MAGSSSMAGSGVMLGLGVLQFLVHRRIIFRVLLNVFFMRFFW